MPAEQQIKSDFSIEALSRLARVSLSEDEKRLFSRQLHDIIGYVNKLNEIDTSAILPTSHVLSIENVEREDTLRGSLPREDALANSPDPSEKFYRVTKIIE